MKDSTQVKKVFFLDKGTNTYYELEEVYINNRFELIIVGGSNKNGISEPPERPIGLDISRKNPEGMFKV